MKKILIILVLLVALLTSCSHGSQDELQQIVNNGFHEVEYKGHSYIMFKYAVGNAGYAGLTHNPDCPCKKGGNDE